MLLNNHKKLNNLIKSLKMYNKYKEYKKLIISNSQKISRP
jgi:hypothetical protein